MRVSAQNPSIHIHSDATHDYMPLAELTEGFRPGIFSVGNFTFFFEEPETLNEFSEFVHKQAARMAAAPLTAEGQVI